MGEFAGKSVIVLGAATPGNMGQAIARRFASQGAKVMVAGRKEAPLKALAEETGGVFCLCDITSKVGVESLVDATLAAFGQVDVGINATGLNISKPFLELSTDDLDRITRVQFIGPILFYQALIRGMKNGGSIIQISSITATMMFDDHAAYMGTKAGTDHVVRALAHEFGGKGIRANIVAPGLTDSPMAAMAFSVPAIIHLFNRETPLGRTGTTDDIAAACMWLASEECYMTGQTLQVNGGATLRRLPRAAEIQAAAISAP